MHAALSFEHCALIDVALLKGVEMEIRSMEKSVALNGFQKWIVDELYDFSVPNDGFSVKSILLVAIPHPMFSDVSFVRDSIRYECVSLVVSDFDAAKETIARDSARNRFSYLEAKNLPLKLMGVLSGMAEYGKNNITYIDGLGSCFSYLAYFTDMEPTVLALSGASVSKTCERCSICLNACPTSAIRPDAFIIDNERCLSCLNETGEPFPDWVPLSAHHSLYDCIQCQVHCPMNRDYASVKGRPISFDEAETAKLIDREACADRDAGLVEKIRYLGLDQWPAGISKNIMKIVEKNKVREMQEKERA